MAVVTRLCKGKQNCTVPATTESFGDPCPGSASNYRLAVQLTCNPPQNNTYWNLSLFDSVVEDFLAATHGGEPILDFSTTPAWMWLPQPKVPHHYPDNPLAVDWDYNIGVELVDPTCTQVGQFYGRLAAWYTSGGFYDEYNHFHPSPHHYNLTMWEVLNEMEHHMNITLYTCIYDAVVHWVREYADPHHRIQFVGLAEKDPTLYDDYRYFLNKSNHAAPDDTPLDWMSYHRYGKTVLSRTNATEYEIFFDQYEQFFTIIEEIETIRTRLSPTTRTTIDEVGIILLNDNDPTAAPFPLVYWNACAATFAYLFAFTSAIGIDVIGSSQLMGYPNLTNVLGGLSPQYPSVSMLNWTTGAGTPRFWVLELLLKEFHTGDALVRTTLNSTRDVYGQAYVSATSPPMQKVLLINKRSSPQQVSVTGAAGGSLQTVDELSGETPARRETLSSDAFRMAPFAVSVVTMPPAQTFLIEAKHGHVRRLRE